MGYLFENMEHMDIQEERRRTREAREELERVKAEYQKMAEYQKKAETELAAALEELERYRAAEREKGNK